MDFAQNHRDHPKHQPKLLRQVQIRPWHQLADGKAEAVEFNVKPDSKVINIPLKDLQTKKGILIAGIIRGHKTVIPAGNDMIVAGDNVVIIAAEQRLEDLDDILR